MTILLGIFIIFAVVAIAVCWLILRKPEPRITVVSQPRLTAGEMAAALRVGEETPLYRAILQMIDEELEGVRAIATQSVKDHGILASWVGGGEVLDRLRARLIQDRLAAFGK